MGDFEGLQAHKAHSAAFHRVKGREKCAKCNLYGCICQLSLKDWVPIRVAAPELVPAGNCPHRCANAGLNCIECYEYDKFKGMIML